MRLFLLAAALAPLLVPAAAVACPREALATRPMVVADNAAPAAAGTAKPDSTAFPNSPNGSPAAGDKGAPVVTDRSACTGAAPTATCGDSPNPSGKADTSDTKAGTPTTVGKTPTP